MQSPLIEWAKVIGSVVGLATGIFVTYWQIRQKRIQGELKLEDNPERCGRHEEAIKRLREDFTASEDRNHEDHKSIFNQLGALSLEIAKLSRNSTKEHP